MKYRAKLQILLWFFCFLCLASCSSRMTVDEARDRATYKLEQYCQNFKIDRSLVKGPEYLGSSVGGYAFVWIAYLPKEGKTDIDIYVSYDGAVKLTTEKSADIKP